MKRLLLVGASAWVLSFGVVACVTSQQSDAEVVRACAGEGYAHIDPPANAERYRSALIADAFRRRSPFREYWFHNSSQGRTVVCNINPDWHPSRGNLCDGRHPPMNEIYATFQDAASGPMKINEETGVVCLD